MHRPRVAADGGCPNHAPARSCSGDRRPRLWLGLVILAAALIIVGSVLSIGKNSPRVRAAFSNMMRSRAIRPLTHPPTLCASPPIVQVTDAQLEACAGLGDQKGCLGYHSQKPIPAVKPPRGRKKCLMDCNGVGDCFALTGMCRCPAGENLGSSTSIGQYQRSIIVSGRALPFKSTESFSGADPVQVGED